MDRIELIKETIKIATESARTGGGPFGAVIVKDGEIISIGHNQVTQRNDPTAHAEVVAIREACKKLNTFELVGCEIYTSCEPCPMCFSAIYWARIKKVYFAANHLDAKSAGFDDAFIYDEIKLDPTYRKIPFEQIKHHAYYAPFDAWNSNQEKTEY